MAEKNKLVGRGLKDLIEEHNVDKVLDGEIIYDVKLEEIKPNPFQPRKIFDQEKIDELASSIKEHGVFQPIILKKVQEGYIIVSGERRYRASKQLGLEKIPAIIRNYHDSKVAEISIVENLQREDLTPIEEANAYQIMIQTMNLTQSEVANKVGKSRSYITNMLGLLKLPTEVQTLILERKLSMGHARTLSKLKNNEKIIELANKAINDNLSVRDIEELSKHESKKNKIQREATTKKYKAEKSLLSKYYTSKVDVNNNKVTFKVNNEEELEKLLERLIKNALSD